MIVDSSALLAILRQEPDWPVFAEALRTADDLKISAATYLEASIVVDCSDDRTLGRRFDNLMERAGMGVVPVDKQQAWVARQAYRDFGKGSGHPARLNFGDCFAYALATVTGEALLYKGDDFSHTDLRSAL